MTRIELISSLHQIGAIKFGNFTLKSGQTSKIYLDLRQIISHPIVLRSVADAIWQKIQHLKPELLCGVPYTALPIATCISLDHHIPMIMRRKEKKSYGTKQQIEGRFSQGQTCLIIEDVLTTGGSILETADDLLAAGLKITDAVVLIDREKEGRKNLRDRQCELHAAFTLSEILQTLQDSSRLNPEEASIIRELINETT